MEFDFISNKSIFPLDLVIQSIVVLVVVKIAIFASKSVKNGKLHDKFSTFSSLFNIATYYNSGPEVGHRMTIASNRNANNNASCDDKNSGISSNFTTCRNATKNINDTAFPATDKFPATDTLPPSGHAGIPPKFYGPCPHPYWLEQLKLFLGAFLLLVCGPYIAFQIAITTLWEFLDTRADLYLGFGLVSTITKASAKLSPYCAHWCRKPDSDGFLVHIAIWLGYIYPLYFFHELYNAHQNGIEWWCPFDGCGEPWSWMVCIPWRVVLYNIVRIGPMYRAFMFCYVWCHKEAHMGGSVFDNNDSRHNTRGGASFPGDSSSSKGGGYYSSSNSTNNTSNSILKRILIPQSNFCANDYFFNHWVGLFHGVVPGTFTFSHLYNHHKYNNDFRDVYSTAYRERDSFPNFLRYLPEWFLYATNVSSISAFLQEGRNKFAFLTILSSLYYWAFVYVCWRIHPTFTLLTLVYALLEANVLLSVVNWVWHGFIDDRDPSSDYINSTNIIEGLNFTANEEYHTVHHQYEGAHWTANVELYEKHHEGYFGSQKKLPLIQKEEARIIPGTGRGGGEDHLSQGNKDESRGNASEDRGNTSDVYASERTSVSDCHLLPPTSFFRANVFEVFGNMVAKNYGQLADWYYKPHARGATREQLMLLLERRMKTHGAALAQEIGRAGKQKRR